MIQGSVLAHSLGGLMLLCTFVLLSQRRLAAMVSLVQAQALVLSAAAFWQGYLQHSPDLFLTGIITLAVMTVLLPEGLRRIVYRMNLVRTVESVLPMGVSMILGILLAGIAVLVVLPRQDLAIALSIVLLGLLVMVVRRNPLSQVIGFLSAMNGLVLAAVSIPGMPFVAVLVVALLVPTALLMLGVFIFRMREHFNVLDLSGIAEIEGRAE